jgi:hypothetical protein
MTAIAEDLDLTSLGDLAPDCDWNRGHCESSAVAVAFWDIDCCGLSVNPMLLCGPHRDRVDADSRVAAGRFVARCYNAVVTLLRIEALR